MRSSLDDVAIEWSTQESSVISLGASILLNSYSDSTSGGVFIWWLVDRFPPTSHYRLVATDRVQNPGSAV
jgi:hypothetical protein